MTRPGARLPMVAATTLGVLVGSGAVAGAYVTARAGGSMEVTVAAARPVVISGPRTLRLTPGEPASLAGVLENPNDFPVRVPGVALGVARVSRDGVPVPVEECDPTGDFTVVHARPQEPIPVPAATEGVPGRASWSGARITLLPRTVRPTEGPTDAPTGGPDVGSSPAPAPEPVATADPTPGVVVQGVTDGCLGTELELIFSATDA